MLTVSQLPDEIVELTHNGDWDEADWQAFQDTMQRLLWRTATPVYVLLDFTDSAHINRDLLHRLLSSRYRSHERFGMAALACGRDSLHRFVSQILEMQTLRDRERPPIRALMNRDDALSVLRQHRLNKRLKDGYIIYG